MLLADWIYGRQELGGILSTSSVILRAHKSLGAISYSGVLSMVEFRVSLTRKQRFLFTVNAASVREAIEQVEVLIKQQGSETSSIFVGSNLADISVEIIPPAHLVPKNFRDIVADLCDICGSVTVMGVNDIFLEGFKPSLVCTKCFDADREGIRAKWEAWSKN